MRCTPHKILFGDEIKKNEVGGTYRTYTGFWWRNMRTRDHWEEDGVDGRIILNRSLWPFMWFNSFTRCQSYTYLADKTDFFNISNLV